MGTVPSFFLNCSIEFLFEQKQVIFFKSQGHFKSHPGVHLKAVFTPLKIGLMDVTSSNVLRKVSLQTKLNAGLSEQQQEDLFQNERSFHEVKL